MSGFDENPFGEPTTDNPFDDPAIQEVTQNVKAQIRVQDYNPFHNQEQNQKLMVSNQDSQPAVMELSQDSPRAYPHNEQQIQPQPKRAINIVELQRRQEELERKQEELARREEEMLRNTYNVRHNNWPPLPKQCCFQPCFYQDIQVDIPLEFQKLVRLLYYLWMFHGIIMIFNVLGGIIVVDFTIIILGIFYLIVFTPFSYLCWFRSAYKAFRSDSSFNFMIFFFIFFFQFVVSIVQALGIPNSGTIGIITAFKKFKHSSTTAGIIAAVMELLIASGFCCAAAADLMLISKIHRVYRSSGASFAKAQSEFSSEFIRNQHVRSAASNLAAAAVQTQFGSDGTTNKR